MLVLVIQLLILLLKIFLFLLLLVKLIVHFYLVELIDQMLEEEKGFAIINLMHIEFFHLPH
ncbi:hypothetical protein EZE46_29220 [Bacillus sp. BH2]|nr:hypothetical protein EZE46_29220 [Bacillus sp. BH2]